jgi:glycosyltransferase involved in cell wall biosynthesis
MSGARVSSSTRTPLVSVLMPTFNCRPFLAESIDCVLAQTLDDFELIIIDDGSTDDSQSLLDQYATRDKRVRVARQKNSGVGAALNAGLDLARGKYLARMDADDRTSPERFAEQITFLDQHPEITVVGGWHRTFGAGGSKTHEFPTEPGHVKASLIFRVPISHPTVMMVREAFIRNRWRYSTLKRFPEDYDLWVTIAERHELTNIPKVYVDYRVWPSSVSQILWERWREQFVEIQCRLLARMGLVPDDPQRGVHEALAFDEIVADVTFLTKAHTWLLTIDRHNRTQPALDSRGLARVLTGRYIALFRVAQRHGLQIDGLADSPFRQNVEIPLG